MIDNNISINQYKLSITNGVPYCDLTDHSHVSQVTGFNCTAVPKERTLRDLYDKGFSICNSKTKLDNYNRKKHDGSNTIMNCNGEKVTMNTKKSCASVFSMRHFTLFMS